MILLVEDEPLLREVTSEDLESLGFEVECARDGDEAIEILAQRTFAALITDIRMPGAVDGWEVARRAREQHPDLPVIYLSGYSDPASEPVEDARLVQKPYRIGDISRALGELGLL